ncbi:hypothetical protein BH23PAT2_BH23PAT2_02090 [soil metagenome]
MSDKKRDLDIESYISQLEADLTGSSLSTGMWYKTIVNNPFKDKITATTLDLGIIVFLLVNRETKTIDRVALSDTDQAKGAVKMSAIPFHDIKIPVSHPDNIISKAISTHAPQQTEDWIDLFTPAFTPQQARFNQLGAGIECSWVFPLNIPNGGALIYSYYQPYRNLTDDHKKFMTAYSNRVSWLLDSTKRKQS